MTETKKTVGQTMMESTEKGVMSNTQVINFEDVKKAWMKFAEVCYKASYEGAIDSIDKTIGFLDKERVIAYLDVAEEVQDLYKAVDKCNSMEDFYNIDFDGEFMSNVFDRFCGIGLVDGEVVVLSNVLKGE